MAAFRSGLPLMCRNLGERREFLCLSLHTQALECSSFRVGLLGCGRQLTRCSLLPSSVNRVKEAPLLQVTPSWPLQPWAAPFTSMWKHHLALQVLHFPAKDPWPLLLSFHPFTFLGLESLHPLPRKAWCSQHLPGNVTHTSPFLLSQMASPQTAPQQGKKQGALIGLRAEDCQVLARRLWKWEGETQHQPRSRVNSTNLPPRSEKKKKNQEKIGNYRFLIN